MEQGEESMIPAASIPIAGAVLGWGIGVWAGFAPAVQALGLLMVFDFVSGFAVAAVRGEIESRVGARGLLKKGYTFALVLLVAYLQRSQLHGMGVDLPATEVLATAFAAMELISILENYQRIGGNLGPLGPYLAIVKQQQKKDDE
jgi:toxin secretion/phage lysis holin